MSLKRESKKHMSKPIPGRKRGGGLYVSYFTVTNSHLKKSLQSAVILPTIDVFLKINSYIETDYNQYFPIYSKVCFSHFSHFRSAPKEAPLINFEEL